MSSGYFESCESNGQQDGVDLTEDDLVFVTNGSLVENSEWGDYHTPAKFDPIVHDGGSWHLWRNIAAQDTSFGRPDKFCTRPEESQWASASITTLDPRIPAYIEKIAKRAIFHVIAQLTRLAIQLMAHTFVRTSEQDLEHSLHVLTLLDLVVDDLLRGRCGGHPSKKATGKRPRRPSWTTVWSLTGGSSPAEALDRTAAMCYGQRSSRMRRRA